MKSLRHQLAENDLDAPKPWNWKGWKEWKKKEEAGGGDAPLPTSQLSGMHSTMIEAAPALSTTTIPSTERHDVIVGPAGGAQAALVDPDVLPHRRTKWMKHRQPWDTVYRTDESSAPLQMHTQAGYDDQRVWIEGAIPADIQHVNLTTMEEDLRRTVTSMGGRKSEYIRAHNYSLLQAKTSMAEENMASRWWYMETPASGTAIAPYVKEYMQKHPVTEWEARGCIYQRALQSFLEQGPKLTRNSKSPG